MALGIVALYVGIAVGISTWLRPYIGYKWWRNLHMLTLLLYALVVVHGIATGSDTRTWWGAAIYALSVLLIGMLLWMRLKKPANAQSRAHPAMAVAVVAAIVVGTVWALLGPFQPGWNATANNGNGSGSTSTALAATSRQTTFPQSFTGDLQGQLTQSGPDDNGNVTLQLDLNISNGPSGHVQVILLGQTDGEGNIAITSSRLTLASSSGQQLYAGSLTNISASRQWYMTAALTGTGANSSSSLQVQMTIQVDASGQATGKITAGSAIPTGGSGLST